jgi:hypothetical protein
MLNFMLLPGDAIAKPATADMEQKTPDSACGAKSGDF